MKVGSSPPQADAVGGKIAFNALQFGFKQLSLMSRGSEATPDIRGPRSANSAAALSQIGFGLLDLQLGVAESSIGGGLLQKQDFAVEGTLVFASILQSLLL